MTSWQQESLQLHVVPIYTETSARTFPALCLPMQGRTQMTHYALLVSSAHNKHSTRGRYNNGNTWTGDGKRRPHDGNTSVALRN